MKAVFNFTVLEEVTFLEILTNRAFCYGDGVFETMLLENGQIRFLEDHYQRLQAGTQVLGMKLSENLTADYLQKTSLILAKACNLGNSARVRLQVWRKAGGLYTPTSTDTDFVCTVSPYVPPSIGIKERVIIYEDIRLVSSPISCYKTCSALPYVLAGLARQAAQADDAILLNVNGFVSECVASNLFWMKDGIWYTPSLESGCIAGIMRGHLLREAGRLRIPVVEGLFTREHLVDSELVFCCNVAGIQLIQSINGIFFDASTAKLAPLITTI